MKVVVMCGVLNEERIIERFCEVYGRFADQIVICDGGSEDRTVEIASSFPGVEVVHFDKQIDFDGVKWNPVGKQWNFGLRAAVEHEPDWVIVDECDSLPTLSLQNNIRDFMQTSKANVIGVHRIYVIGTDEFFPILSNKGFFGWAFQPEKVDASYFEGNPMPFRRSNLPDPSRWRKLGPPYALLHLGWPDAQTVQEKTARYQAIGKLPSHGNAIPNYAGTPKPLPEWATWESDE